MWRIATGLAVILSVQACSEPQSTGLPDFTGLIEKAAPAIVNVSGTAEVAKAGPQAIPPLFEWFREFIDPEQSDDADADGVPKRSLGSGFLISEDGEILTNNHVISGATEVRVTLADQRAFTATVMGRDPASDLALLKIDADDLPHLRFGKSAPLKVGEWVLAIGSPFGFEQTATAGIISGKRRALGSEQYVPFLQTDVAINPGNSGGPLFNLKGEVIGINSQIFSQTGGYMGLSFAIPSDTAVNVIKQLREFGRVRRGWLGVVIQNVDAALAKSFGLEQATGALISHVDPAGPAAKAGLQSGDVILDIDGETVPSSAALPPMVGRHSPGEKVKISIIREGHQSKLQVVLGELPRGDAEAAIDWLGLQSEPLNDRQRTRLNLDHGLVVRALEANGAAAQAGLRPGDVLLTLGGKPLVAAEDLLREANLLAPGSSGALLVMRDNRSLFVALQRPVASD